MFFSENRIVEHTSFLRTDLVRCDSYLHCQVLLTNGRDGIQREIKLESMQETLGKSYNEHSGQRYSAHCSPAVQKNEHVLRYSFKAI